MGKRRGEKPSGWTVTTASMPGPALLGPTAHTISMEMLAGRWVRCLELLGRYVGRSRQVTKGLGRWLDRFVPG